MKRLTFRLLMACSQNYRLEKQPNIFRQIRTLAAIFVVVLMNFAVLQPAADAQPPQYELTILNEENTIWPPEWPSGAAIDILPYDINEDGIVVGYARNLSTPVGKNHRAFVYVQDTNRMYDLNDLEYQAVWIDMETGNPTTDAWFAWKATGINEQDQIVGIAVSPDALVERFFVLNAPLGSVPTFQLLPLLGSTTPYPHSARINDSGVVAGSSGGVVVYDPANNYQPIDTGGTGWQVRDINNFGDIVTGGLNEPAQIIVPDASGDYAVYPFSNLAFSGLNDLRIVTGQRFPISKGRDKQDGGPIRFDFGLYLQDANTVPELLKSEKPVFWHGDVNLSGNIFFGTGDSAFLFLEGQGSFSLDDYLVFEPGEASAWFAEIVTPSGITDNGKLICWGDNNSFLLTPIVPGPTLSVNDLEIDEGGNGTTTEGQFTVALSELTGEDVTVPYTIHDGTATTGDDYTTIASSGLLTFAFSAGETSKTVEFTIVGDDTSEPDEMFTIVLGEALGGATVTSGTGTATIKNDDGGSAMYSSNDTPKNIRDRKNTFSTISIGDDYGIAGMTVNLDISHNRPSDLSVTLIGPDGTETPLLNFSGNNYVIAFNDTSSIGNWTLKVRDNNRGEKGTLNGWSITVDY